MGLRFRKRVSLGFGWVNISLTGVSLTVGARGANVNLGGFGRGRVPRATVGLPGSGFYYQTKLGEPSRATWIVFGVVVWAIVLLYLL